MTYFNRLKTAITNNPGTGDFSIGNAFPEYKTLIAADNGKTLDILIQEGSSWEIRKNCTFTFATLTLTRGTLVDSSTGGAISFTNAATIANVILAERVVPFENNQIITATGSVGAPSYSFTGLTNQGITSYSSDTIALCNSGQINLLLNGPTNIVNYPKISASTTGNPIKIEANGTDTDINLINITKGSGEHQFATNASSSNVQLRVKHTANAVNYVNIAGGTTGYGPTISVDGSDTNSQLVLYSKGTSSVVLSTGAASNKQFAILHMANAVNFMEFNGGAAGGYVTLAARGNDTNVHLLYKVQGAGSHNFTTNNSNSNRHLAITSTTSAVNYANITGAATGTGPIFSVAGTDTNIDLNLNPKGTGRIRENTKYVKSYSQDDGWMDVLPMFVKDDGTNGFSFGQIGATGRFALFCAGNGQAKTIYCLYHMPHDLKLSQTTSYFHIHWEPPNTNAGNIIVVASIQAALRDGTWSSFYDHTFTLTPSGQVANRHVVTELQLDTNLNSYLEPDAIFFVKISRDPAAVADTYADEFYFHQADIHTQTDGRNTTSKDKSTGWVKI